MNHLKIAIAVLLTTTLMSASFAQGPGAKGEGKGKGERKGRTHMGEMRGKLLEKFDKDGDGKISEEERKGAILAKVTEMMAKFDKDGDGKLSPEEFMAMHKDRMAKRGQGRGTGNAAPGQGGPGRGKGGMREKIIEKFDKDGDGKLSEEERTAAREMMKQRRGGKGRHGKGAKAAE